jgi:hypothetical protein
MTSWNHWVPVLFLVERIKKLFRVIVTVSCLRSFKVLRCSIGTLAIFSSVRSRPPVLLVNGKLDDGQPSPPPETNFGQSQTTRTKSRSVFSRPFVYDSYVRSFSCCNYRIAVVAVVNCKPLWKICCTFLPFDSLQSEKDLFLRWVWIFFVWQETCAMSLASSCFYYGYAWRKMRKVRLVTAAT